MEWLKNIVRRKSRDTEASHFSHILYIDETGTDGRTNKIAYIGCLFDAQGSTGLTEKIMAFNQDLLDQPRFAGKNGGVMRADESRHYVDDHFTVRELFYRKVIDKLPMRVYVVSASYDKDNLEDIKLKLMTRLIEVARSTKRVTNLEIVAEASSKNFDQKFQDVVFKNKEYLPLSIADYIAGGVRACYEIIAKARAGEKITEKSSSFNFQFYFSIENMIAYEQDTSANTISGRRRRSVGDELRSVLQ